MSKYPRLSKLVTYNVVSTSLQREVQREYEMLGVIRNLWDKEFPLDLLSRDVINERVDIPEFKTAMLKCLDELERLGQIAEEVNAEVEAFQEEFAE